MASRTIKDFLANFFNFFCEKKLTPKVTRAASAATFHGSKDVYLIVRSSVVEEDDDLNEGFCHYSIIDDE